MSRSFPDSSFPHPQVVHSSQCRSCGKCRQRNAKKDTVMTDNRLPLLLLHPRIKSRSSLDSSFPHPQVALHQHSVILSMSFVCKCRQRVLNTPLHLMRRIKFLKEVECEHSGVVFLLLIFVNSLTVRFEWQFFPTL